jgi:predicted nucleic acid-binding protein
MKFWDSSALVPLLIAEATSPVLRPLAAADHEMVVAWTAEIECASALLRTWREQGEVTDPEVPFSLLTALAQQWQVVELVESLRTLAIRMLRVHPLRAADALQLAAAVIAAGDQPSALPFVSLDSRLRAAAAREGFPLLPA